MSDGFEKWSDRLSLLFYMISVRLFSLQSIIMVYKKHMKKLGSRELFSFNFALKNSEYISIENSFILILLQEFLELLLFLFCVTSKWEKITLLIISVISFILLVNSFFFIRKFFYFYWDFMHSCVILWDLVWKLLQDIYLENSSEHHVYPSITFIVNPIVSHKNA